MKNFRWLVACATVLSFTSFAWGSWQAGSRAPTLPAVRIMQDPSAFKSAEGTLTKVDEAKRIISIKTADGKESAFQITSQTQVTGGDNSVAGLAKLIGTKLKIAYQLVGRDMQAVKIEAIGVSS